MSYNKVENISYKSILTRGENAINTALQLATYKNETLGYEHMSRTDSVVDDFEKYVLNVHGGDGGEEDTRRIGKR